MAGVEGLEPPAPVLENGWITYPVSTALNSLRKYKAYETSHYGIVNTFQPVLAFCTFFVPEKVYDDAAHFPYSWQHS